MITSEHGPAKHLVHYAGLNEKGEHVYETFRGKTFRSKDRQKAEYSALKHMGLNPKDFA